MSNQTPISVTAVRFTNQFETIPKRIELDGISYDLDGDYKRVTLKSDDGDMSIFDVGVGPKRFRLRQQLLEWRLISTYSTKA